MKSMAFVYFLNKNEMKMVVNTIMLIGKVCQEIKKRTPKHAAHPKDAKIKGNPIYR